MNKRLTQILDVSPYTITCLFDTGEKRSIDFTEYLQTNKANKIIAALLNKAFFMNVVINEVGGLVWPNGFDCSARKLYYWDENLIPA
ncbi:MAG: DUF2442 domain-containing protein [Lentimicrobiaceae bacterium]|jgi:hypothetical protein